MKMQKVKEFVKTHKKEVLIGTATVVGGVILFAITKKKPVFSKGSKLDPMISNWRAIEDAKIEALDWKVGKMTDLWNEGGCINGIVNDVTVGDLGGFGKELLKIEGVTDDSIVDMVIGLADKSEK